jgi:D-lactate dehydrogenase
MDKISIYFYDTKPYDRNTFEEINKQYGDKLKFFKGHLNPDTAELSKGADAICIFVNDMLTEEVAKILERNNVRLVALRCAGYNNVDLHAIKNRFKVARVPAYSPHAVAEHTLAMILSLNRKIHRAYYRIRDINFNIDGLLGFDMVGKTAGVVGTGKIGRVLIRILRGLDMNVLAYDPYPNEKAAENLGFKYVELDDLYKNSDIISLNCPLTKETFHMINNSSLSMMKPNVMIVNTGRGQLINSKDLIEALKDHKIGSAALDVYEEESEYFFEDHSSTTIQDDVLARLITFNNVLITSHQGFFTKEALQSIARTTFENIHKYLIDGKIQNEVCEKCPD